MPASFIYPAGRAPGFDPTHPAARNGMFSVIASGANVVDAMSGLRATIVNTPTFSINGNMGLVTKYATNARSTYTMAGPSSPVSATAAAIFQIDTISGTTANIIMRQGAINSTIFRTLQTTGILTFGAGAGAGGLTVIAATPYFAACSLFGGSTLNSVLLNLKTGQLLTESLATAAIVNATATANQYIGNNDAGTAPLIGSIAAAMWAYNSFLSLPDLIKWAADPWSFWYPRRTFYQIKSSAAAFPYWAVRNNDFVIGTGVQ